MEKKKMKKKKNPDTVESVSGNHWPYNIAVQAKVDYDSEIGSEAWNIPLVIFPTPSSFHGSSLGPDLQEGGRAGGSLGSGGPRLS